MSSKRYEVDFEKSIKVEIEDPKSIEAYFIHGEWKDFFWTLDDLEDFVRSLSHSFENHPEYWDSERGGLSRSVEGFGIYNRPAGKNAYHLVDEDAKEIGSKISIVDEDLEAMFVTERTS